MLLCKLLGFECAVPSAGWRYRGIWLVGERGTDARDNGYWFWSLSAHTAPGASRLLICHHRRQPGCCKDYRSGAAAVQPEPLSAVLLRRLSGGYPM